MPGTSGAGRRSLSGAGKKPGQKDGYDLVAVEKQGLGLINMDSQAPNQVAGEWLASPLARQVLPDKPEAIHPEYTYGKSRVDFYFECSGEKCLMEVKGVTWSGRHCLLPGCAH